MGGNPKAEDLDSYIVEHRDQAKSSVISGFIFELEVHYSYNARTPRLTLKQVVDGLSPEAQKGGRWRLETGDWRGCTYKTFTPTTVLNCLGK